MLKGSKKMLYQISIGVILLSVTSCASARPVIGVDSPDSQIRAVIDLKSNGDQQQLVYSVTYESKPLLVESPIELSFKDQPALDSDLELVGGDSKELNESWRRLWGKRTHVVNLCNEQTVTLREKTGLKRRIEFIFRAYNDGVAFRYYLPEQPAFETFGLASEKTHFLFANKNPAWPTKWGRFKLAQEVEFEQDQITNLTPKDILGTPLLVQAGQNAWAAILEANLTDWAGMFLAGSDIDSKGVMTKHAPHPQDKSVIVQSAAPRYSPWRVILIGDSPGDLFESDIIHNLNAPCAIADPSWIKPGRCAWDWWWPGRYAPDVDFKLGPNNETMKYFIDFAAEMGWEYQLVDWQWYGPPFEPKPNDPHAYNPNVDITQQIDAIDIPMLVKYAASKNVKLFIWLMWKHVDLQMDEAFPLYEKWGVAGVKIDFMDRNDQEMVNFYHRTVKKAAEHHLMVDFHGAYCPTGWERTYPNFMTREGILGNEYNKWSERITPDHCLTIPFTRGLVGHMDFTPGGFRHAAQGEFKAVGGNAPAPMVRGTRCFQLAESIVYESAVTIYCDTPYEYRKSPAGLDFYKICPTTWDDTKVINAKVGDYITVARRSGNQWFVGSMTDWTPRTLKIPLDFLANGQYSAKIWADGLQANQKPEQVRQEIKTVTAGDTIEAKLAPAGGHILVLTPENDL